MVRNTVRLDTKFKFILVSFFWMVSLHNTSAQTKLQILPALTDSLIDTHLEAHYVAINMQTTPAEKLFVFLPGTTGIPDNYRLIVEEAANMGLHSIGLTYPNQVAINSVDICGASVDLNCHARARQEIFSGTDLHIGVEVDSANSIANRLIKLLQYLHQQFPLERWDLYFNNDTILWEKVVISGHSQGGGHAGYIASQKLVSRAVMFAVADVLFALNRSAGWVDGVQATPAERYFGFAHMQDELVAFSRVTSFWDDLDMFSSSSLILTDTADSPFSFSQTLFTQITPALLPGQFHGSVAVDVFTPKDGQNKPVLAPVWRYLIGEDMLTPVLHLQAKNSTINFYPNPVEHFFSVRSEELIRTFTIFNMQGQIVLAGSPSSLNEFKIDIRQLQAGMYVLSLQHSENTWQTKFLKK